MALTLISSFLLSSPELMMVCDQYFPYIYYFYTHLLRARASKLPIGMHFFFYPKNIKTLLPSFLLRGKMTTVGRDLCAKTQNGNHFATLQRAP